MRMTNLISASLLSAVLCAGVAEASLAQGGWRQWEVRLRWRDGATNVGRITLAHIRWSEGVVVQRGDTVDVRDVAYLVFAAPDSASTTCQRQESWQQPDLTYPIGSQQAPALCFGYCRT